MGGASACRLAFEVECSSLKASLLNTEGAGAFDISLQERRFVIYWKDVYISSSVKVIGA